MKDYHFLLAYSKHISHWIFLCWRSLDCICVGLILGFLFCSIDLTVWLYGCTLLFWLLYVWNIFWNHSVMAAVLFFFVEITLATWGILFFSFFSFYINFRIFFYSIKNAIGIFIRTAHVSLCSTQVKIKLSQKRKRQKGETELFEAYKKLKQEIGGCKHKHTNNY